MCALCYFAAIFANNAGMFVLAIAMAAFWNDMTMGAAWASCLDIGRKYSGIVAGCMNTVGNLGGFVAGFLTGYILDQVKHHDLPTLATSTLGLIGSPLGQGPLLATSAYQGSILKASQTGWNVNFLLFTAVYVVATLLWLGFDATKPVAE